MTTQTKNPFAERFEIFRAGTHTASNGQTVTITADQLDSIVANYNAADPAPLVVGHPKLNDPAWGWVGELVRDGESLFATAKDVVAEFAEAVAKKMYRKRSASIVPDGAGGYRLRHVGFLGGQAPAVPGMADLAYAADADASELVVEFAMSDAERSEAGYGFRAVARLLRRLRDALIADKGIEAADALVPDYEIDALAQAGDALRRSPAAEFTEHTPPKINHEDNSMGEKTFTQAEIDAAVAAAVSPLQQQIDAGKTAAEFAERKRQAAVVIDAAVKEGRLLPAQVPGLAEFVASQPSDGVTLEFSVGEGDKAKTQKQSPFDFALALVGGLGKQLDLGSNLGDAPDDDAADFAEAPRGGVVDPERYKLHRQALDYVAKNNCDYLTAVTAIEQK